MAKIAAALHLSPAEIDAVMARETRLRIATLGPGCGPDNSINLTPMAFGWAGGKVYIFARGQKVADLRRNSTATVLVDSGDDWRQLLGIMMRGQAKVLESQAAEAADPDLAAAQWNIGEKHQPATGGEVKPHGASAAGKSRRWIVFQPQTTVTWDNSKLP